MLCATPWPQLVVLRDAFEMGKASRGLKVP